MHTQKNKLNNFFPTSLVNFNNLKNITLKMIMYSIIQFLTLKKNYTVIFIFSSKVKFTLKRRPNNNQSFLHRYQKPLGDPDSRQSSPTGSLNSAIIRRRRHRASRSSFAWITHGQTVHPKSQKNNIERLIKLILDQGEVIQQQLAKLRCIKYLKLDVVLVNQAQVENFSFKFDITFISMIFSGTRNALTVSRPWIFFRKKILKIVT
jgi:hypothetical protein